MFGKNETVCFLGDSITTHGHFIKEIFEFLAKNHKDDRVKLFNCGVPGDAASRTVHRLHEDCLIFNPDKVILMLGVNDIEVALYKNGVDIENKEERKQHFLDLYEENMIKIIENCQSFGAEVILCTPTVLDDKKIKSSGCEDAILKCIEFLKKQVKERNLKMVDYHTTMAGMIDEVLGDDGVHPTEKGHHIMAQILLKALGYIEECDFDAVPQYSQKNIERYNVEQVYRDVRMLEWCSMFDFNTANPDATYNEKIEIAKEKREDGVKAKTEWFIKTADNYIEYFHKVPKLQGELMRKTIEMYD